MFTVVPVEPRTGRQIAAGFIRVEHDSVPDYRGDTNAGRDRGAYERPEIRQWEGAARRPVAITARSPFRARTAQCASNESAPRGSSVGLHSVSRLCRSKFVRNRRLQRAQDLTFVLD